MAKTNKKKTGSAFYTGVKLWISSRSGKGVFGEGKYRLLKAIRETGSLRSAAETEGISYRKAWGDIRAAEQRTGRKLITRKRGGTDGGSSALTPFAEKLIEVYGPFRDTVRDFAAAQFDKKLKKFFT